MGFTENASRIVAENIATHNISSTAHDDIRQLIIGLNNKLNTVLDSDDSTLDQLSEIVNYIKDNRDLIETITTSKINVSDIIDNLTTTSNNKPLSAKQGKILKDLIDAIVIPTKVSAFVNDKGYLTEHQSLNGYATEQWVENKNYLTQHQDISGKGNKIVITLTGNNDSDELIPSLTYNEINNHLLAGDYIIIDNNGVALPYVTKYVIDNITMFVFGFSVLFQEVYLTQGYGITPNNTAIPLWSYGALNQFTDVEVEEIHNFCNSELYVTDDDNGTVTLHFGIQE